MDFSNIYWLDRELAWYGKATGRIDAEVAIIGGGITGITAAEYLARHDVETVLVEKRLIGTGASGRNAGFVITGPVEHYARAVKILGREKARRLWEDSLEGIGVIRDNMDRYHIDADIHQGGSLLLAATEAEDAEARETVEELNHDGMSALYLDASETARRLNTDAYFGACLLENNFGYNPYKYVSSLANGLRGLSNLQICDQTEIISIQRGHDAIVLRNEETEIHCQMLLIAANAWAQKLNSWFEDKIIPVRGQVIATKALPDRVWNELVYANFGFEYFRQLPGGELIIGGWRENMPGGDAFHYNEFIDDKAVDGLMDYVRSNFPAMPELEVTHKWGGIMGFSRDGLPLLGPLPGESRIITAAGFTGHGMAFGSVIGRFAAQAILGTLDTDISMYALSRFNS